ncbi:MAG: hypothetical protein IBX59_00560 [Yoonia sp.]|nr:hypothetical protein [Yoonia sp.]
MACDARLLWLAWHVGNRHVPCAVAADALILQREKVMRAMLEQLGATVTDFDGTFTLEGGAYGPARYGLSCGREAGRRVGWPACCANCAGVVARLCQQSGAVSTAPDACGANGRAAYFGGPYTSVRGDGGNGCTGRAG